MADVKSEDFPSKRIRLSPEREIEGLSPPKVQKFVNKDYLVDEETFLSDFSAFQETPSSSREQDGRNNDTQKHEQFESDDFPGCFSVEDDIDNIEEHHYQPIAGPMGWVQRQMTLGINPREILSYMVPHAKVPSDLQESQSTLWKIIIDLLTAPTPRQKLDFVNTIDDVVNLIKSCKNIVVLTGAGVSVSCGIPDFRSRDGIYARLSEEYPDLPDPQAMFDITYFNHNPKPFFKFAKEIYPGQFKPSLSHRFIHLIEEHGRLLRNYSQNIDTLEQIAGITRVIQCHGSFSTASCTNCKYQVSSSAIKDDIFNQAIPICPKCKKEEHFAIMKPDIVFFGENLPSDFYHHLEEDSEKADLLIVIGSSLKVRPVALIPSRIAEDVPQILINREPLRHMTFDVELLGDCDVIVTELCKRLGESWTTILDGSDVPPVKRAMYSGLLDTSSTNLSSDNTDSKQTLESETHGEIEIHDSTSQESQLMNFGNPFGYHQPTTVVELQKQPVTDVPLAETPKVDTPTVDTPIVNKPIPDKLPSQQSLAHEPLGKQPIPDTQLINQDMSLVNQPITNIPLPQQPTSESKPNHSISDITLLNPPSVPLLHQPTTDIPNVEQKQPPLSQQKQKPLTNECSSNSSIQAGLNTSTIPATIDVDQRQEKVASQYGFVPCPGIGSGFGPGAVPDRKDENLRVYQPGESSVQCQHVGQDHKEQDSSILCSVTGPVSGQATVQEARQPASCCQSVGEDTSFMMSSSGESNTDNLREEPLVPGDISSTCQYPSNEQSIAADADSQPFLYIPPSRYIFYGAEITNSPLHSPFGSPTHDNNADSSNCSNSDNGSLSRDGFELSVLEGNGYSSGEGSEGYGSGVMSATDLSSYDLKLITGALGDYSCFSEENSVMSGVDLFSEESRDDRIDNLTINPVILQSNLQQGNTGIIGPVLDAPNDSIENNVCLSLNDKDSKVISPNQFESFSCTSLSSNEGNIYSS